MLVEYSIVTRVIIDTDDSDNQAIKKAKTKIIADAENYVIGDNVVIVKADTECPYGTFDEDN